MTSTNLPAIKTFPHGATHPSAAVYVCPFCGTRHWAALSSASSTVHCPNTGELISLDLTAAKSAGR